MNKIYNILKSLSFSTSDHYWDKRYRDGGGSGEGSYGFLAEFKAEIVNWLISQYKLSSIVELGCGDGNQAALFNATRYLGLDTSTKAIELARKNNSNNDHMRFSLYSHEELTKNLANWRSDISLSLDVIYHLVEDEIYQGYLADLFALSNSYVLIYSSNHEDKRLFRLRHVRHREFTKDIAQLMLDWELKEFIKNKYPSNSHANFYLYKKLS